MNRVSHFDIYADDPQRAAKFYSDVFGWTFEKWEGGGGMNYWLIMTGPKDAPGINGGMSLREKEWAKSSSQNSLTIDVEDIDAAMEKIKSAGGTITMKKMHLPDVGWFANFKDPEGNTLSLIQMENPNAEM